MKHKDLLNVVLDVDDFVVFPYLSKSTGLGIFQICALTDKMIVIEIVYPIVKKRKKNYIYSNAVIKIDSELVTLKLLSGE